ncbi:MAG TPA: prolyl oligopeptidase family serine peptidase [Kofleriaceae bacterium]|jgi:dipeptidyl aminopeptidase/acylaminoacyl peptidase|nr:prolyl oligopeptidase family serine peptidase [Kofleriaceae bacterium]
MRSTPILALVVALVAACGAPAKSSPSASPAAPPSEPAPPAAAPTPPPAPIAVNADPDTPAGADAARDAELARAAGAVVDAFVNVQPVLTRDGKRVVFVSDRDGLPQLYVADAGKPDAPATRLVTSTDRVTGPVPTLDGKAVVFQSDHGADENWTYFRVNLDGSGLVELTPGAKRQRNPAHIADAKPDTIFYSARAMSDVGTGVYMMPAKAPGEEKQIFHDDKPGTLIDVSRDGKWGLFQRFPSRAENYLVAIDLATGAARPVWPRGDAKVSIFAASFSADGRRAIVATDGGGEQALLLSIDVATGKETARYVETRPVTGLLSAVAVAHQGNAAAVTVDAGTHTEIRLLDAATLKPRAAVALPLGTGGIGRFSQDGKRLTLTWSTPNAPTDIHAVEVATGKLAPLRKDARPQLDGLPPIEASVVEVDAFDHQKIPVNVFVPAGSKGKKLPVIVNYHGGPSGSSAIRWSAQSRFFLGQGYAWVEPNVRGSTGFGRAYEAADNGHQRLDAFKDIETTGRWAAAQPWADKDRVVVFGGSYGGYTVLVALTRYPDIWRAGVDLFGVASLKTFMSTTSGFIREIFLLEFGDPDQDAAFLDSISPLRDADKIVDPLFVYAGANDPRVPRSESDLIVKALRGRSVPVEYMVAANEGHSLSHRENIVGFLARSARFLENHMK